MFSAPKGVSMQFIASYSYEDESEPARIFVMDSGANMQHPVSDLHIAAKYIFQVAEHSSTFKLSMHDIRMSQSIGFGQALIKTHWTRTALMTTRATPKTIMRKFNMGLVCSAKRSALWGPHSSRMEHHRASLDALKQQLSEFRDLRMIAKARSGTTSL